MCFNYITGSTAFYSIAHSFGNGEYSCKSILFEGVLTIYKAHTERAFFLQNRIVSQQRTRVLVRSPVWMHISFD